MTTIYASSDMIIVVHSSKQVEDLLTGHRLEYLVAQQIKLVTLDAALINLADQSKTEFMKRLGEPYVPEITWVCTLNVTPSASLDDPSIMYHQQALIEFMSFAIKKHLITGHESVVLFTDYILTETLENIDFPYLSYVGFKEFFRDIFERSLRISDWIIDERLKPGRQVFAVGDVHGHPLGLDKILSAMASYARNNSHLVLLGDIIDKGPDSPGAVKVATDWLTNGAFEDNTLLLGNHDLFFHSAVRQDRDAIKIWGYNGARAFQIAVGAKYTTDVRECLIDKIGIEAVTRYESAESHIEIGNLLLVHAGIPPSQPLKLVFAAEKFSSSWTYDEYDHWAWIRLPFLEYEGPFQGNRFVIHGHTGELYVIRHKKRSRPDPLHQLDGWRLGLDGTGGDNPTISGAQIEDGRYRIFTVACIEEYFSLNT